MNGFARAGQIHDALRIIPEELPDAREDLSFRAECTHPTCIQRSLERLAHVCATLLTSPFALRNGTVLAAGWEGS